jgi:hypothetical protein
MNTKFFKTASLLLIIALLSACGPQATPEPTVDINAVYTQAYETVSADLTAQALANPSATPEPTATLAPTETPTLAPTIPVLPPTNTAVPALPTALVPPTATSNPQTAVGCYNAALVADVTIPYGTKMDPGDKFTKTWRVKNTGGCPWTDEFKIAYAGGDMFGSDTTKIRFKLGPNGVADISLDMIAPNKTGTVSSSWQMMTDAGKPFGQVMTVTITLPGGEATATPAKTDCGAAFVSVSVENGTQFNKGESFTQTFTFKNNGKCSWESDFKIQYVGGNVLGSDSTKIRQKVEPGGSMTISLKMVAPSDAGEYTSSWQMMDNGGKTFGPVVTFTIKVK